MSALARLSRREGGLDRCGAREGRGWDGIRPRWSCHSDKRPQMESTRQPSSMRYESRRIDVIHRHGSLKLEDAIDDVDRLFDAGVIDQAELAVLDLRKFGHRFGFSLRHRDVNGRVVFVDD